MTDIDKILWIFAVIMWGIGGFKLLFNENAARIDFLLLGLMFAGLTMVF